MDLNHGGQLHRAVREFSRPAQDWLDLSTGISPWSWPVPDVPAAVWQELPDDNGQLEASAARYYGVQQSALLAVPGSQYALQSLPRYLRRGTVAVPERGYGEHHHALHKAGHTLVTYRSIECLQSLVHERKVNHVLVINPNNPTAERYPTSLLLALLRQLQERQGSLLVDEAFADCDAGDSLASACPREGLVVYRSLGKFFGLAGLRLGFVMAPAPLLEQLRDSMGPWLIGHPARWLGERALLDSAWQAQQRERLLGAGNSWREALATMLPALSVSATELFVTGSGPANYCHGLYSALGRRAVLVRLFDSIGGRGMIRFGLPLTDDRQFALDQVSAAARECACLLD